MRKTLIALTAGVALVAFGGCAQTGAITAVVVEKKMQLNDAKARLTLVAPCDIAVGSFFRALSPPEQRAVEALCGGEAMPRPSTLTPNG
jgi:hypothetical protein